MIRKVNSQDTKAITGIYNEYITGSNTTFETEPVTEEEMQLRIDAISEHFPYYVCELDGVVAGYCYAHHWKTRAAYRYTLETTVYLSPGYVGKGIGTELMRKLIEDCRKGGFHALIACITEGNDASRTLHEKLGFRRVSHFKKVGRKFGRWLDVADYELMLE